MTDHATIKRAPHSKDNPYFLMARLTAQDTQLSYQALGLLTHLLSLPTDWEVNVFTLYRGKGNKRDFCYAAITELCEKGYMTPRSKYQDDKGHWHWTPYYVSESPIPESQRMRIEPYTEYPYTGEPYTEKAEIKTEDTKTKEISTEEKKKRSTLLNQTRPTKQDDSLRAATQTRAASLSDQPDIVEGSEMEPLSVQGIELSSQEAIAQERTTQTTQDKGPLPKSSAKKVSPPPAAPKPERKRSAKQTERDEAMEALAAAMGVTLTKADYALYSKISRELIESTIPACEFKTYVQRVRKSTDGKWTVTINSLIANGRPSEYVTARNAYNAQQGAKKTPHVYLGQEVSKNAYNPRSDPAYAQPLEKSS